MKLNYTKKLSKQQSILLAFADAVVSLQRRNYYIDYYLIDNGQLKIENENKSITNYETTFDISQLRDAVLRFSPPLWGGAGGGVDLI
jgi:hypothetical protein